MSAECGRPARRDGAHDAAFDAPEVTGVRLSKSFAMAAEDIVSVRPAPPWRWAEARGRIAH
jgi:hypothetical protein